MELLKLSGGRIVNTHNNLPLFISTIKSDATWDLIIIAVESRDIIRLGTLGVYNEVVSHVENGGALIVEDWNMDEDSSDLTTFIEDKCAIGVEKTWVRPESYTYSDYLLYNLNQGLPIFDTPFKINLPMRPQHLLDGRYWRLDC